LPEYGQSEGHCDRSATRGLAPRAVPWLNADIPNDSLVEADSAPTAARAPGGARWIRHPAALVLYAMLVVVSLAVAADPPVGPRGWDVLVAAVAIGWVSVICFWCVTLGLKRGDATVRRRWWILWLVLGVGTAASIVTDLPARARFAVSRSALDRDAESRLEPGGGAFEQDVRVGLYWFSSIGIDAPYILYGTKMSGRKVVLLYLGGSSAPLDDCEDLGGRWQLCRHGVY
jgi:hypothetical protein